MKTFENLTTHEEAEDVARQNLYCSRSSTWQKSFVLALCVVVAVCVFALCVIVFFAFLTNLARALHPWGPVAKRDGGGDFPPRREARSA